MNLQEFSEFEQHPELSVLARLMYAFYLKKQVMRCASSRIPVTHAGVQAALALQLSSGEQSQPEPAKIEAALAQLASTKLVTVQERQEETVWVELPMSTTYPSAVCDDGLLAAVAADSRLLEALRHYGCQVGARRAAQLCGLLVGSA